MDYRDDRTDSGYYSGRNDGSSTGQYSGNYYDTSYREVQTEKADQNKKKKGKGVLAKVFLVLIGMLAGAGICFGVLTFAVQDKNQGTPEIMEDIQEDLSEKDEDATEETLQDNILEDILDDDDVLDTSDAGYVMNVQEIAELGLPSVVAITNKGITEVQSLWGNFTQESESSGSGVIIGQTESELLILTNYHVIEGNEQLTVVFSYEEELDEEQEAEDTHMTTALVKDYDSSRDIAVIAVSLDQLSDETLDQITVAAIGDSTQLELGQQVVAIGNALGYGQSVTTGIVSALNRSVSDMESNAIGHANHYIQTDAAINPGNSGGALFNMNGQLIGINSAKIASSSVEGMGYAIPISDIFSDVESMMSQETREMVAEENRGYLGVSVVDVTADVSKSYGLPQGVYINSIMEDSGAERAGMKKGDIVTAVNGKIVRTISELKEYLSYYAVGETVTLTLQRVTENGYQESTLDVVLTPATESEETQESMPSQETEPDSNSDYYNPFGSFFPFRFMP